jgi:predicted nucleotidyltransferase
MSMSEDAASPPRSSIELQAATAFVGQVHQKYPKRILNIVLFGSKARGDGQPTTCRDHDCKDSNRD